MKYGLLDYDTANHNATAWPYGIEGMQVIVKIELKRQFCIPQLSVTLERELQKGVHNSSCVFCSNDCLLRLWRMG